jgi:predicted MFS family arabinose efflux permease
MTLGHPKSQALFFLLCGFLLVVDTLFFTALTPLLPYYAERFDLSTVEVGLFAGAYPAGGAFAAIPAGLVATRIGAKSSLLAGLAILTVTSAWFGLATTGSELLLLRFVHGIGSTLSWIAAFSWLLATVSPQRRGETIGQGYGASMVGALLGPAVAPAVPEIGPGLTFALMAVLFAVLFAGFLPYSGPPTGDIQLRSGLRLLIRTSAVIAGFSLLTLQAVVFGALSVLGPLRLAELGFTVAAISIVYLITGGLAIGVSPVAGRWSDRRGRLEPMQYSLAAAIIAIAVLPWFSRGWLFALALVVTSLILFLLSAPASAIVTDAVDTRELGFALGWSVILLGWGPGSVVGAVGAGWLLETSADLVPYAILSAFCAGTLVVLRGERARQSIELVPSPVRRSAKRLPASRRQPARSRPW